MSKSNRIAVPKSVQKEAALSLVLKKAGYSGGTETGFRRARQLIKGSVDMKTLLTMRNWFARHLYTSHPGYEKWKIDGRPKVLITGKKNSYRGAVAYLLWGGESAYKWINSAKIQRKLDSYSPKSSPHKLPK